MHYTLQNDLFRVTIASRGAELISLKPQGQHLEYLWQADPAVWGRHAPILFPIVGRLVNDTYTVEGQSYSMSQHGYARDSEFNCTNQTAEQITLQLNANETTRSRYPFEFSLSVTYRLEGNQLLVSYRVENWQQSAIYFSIGAHPGFTCPLLPGSAFEDYQLIWNQTETLDRHYLTEGLRDGRQAPLMVGSNVLPLRHDLFKDDALIVQSPQSEKLTLAHQSQGPILTVHFSGFPYLGIWSKPSPEATFVCIEPWQGVADRQDFNGSFSEKEGIQSLQPGEKHHCGYTIEIH